jgi:hypothetical protein
MRMSESLISLICSRPTHLEIVMNQPTQPKSPTPDSTVTPDAILQLGFAFWGSKTLLSAIELGLFTLLADGPLSVETVTARLALHPRSVRDFLDALVALNQLERKDGLYCNTAAGALFLDRRKPTYIGGILEMANSRLYPFWGSLTDGLRTGDPQNEAKAGRDLFDEIYRDPAILAEFLKAMSGLSLGAANAISVKFPWADYKSFADIGTAQGAVPVMLAQAHPHLFGRPSESPGTSRPSPAQLELRFGPRPSQPRRAGQGLQHDRAPRRLRQG